MSEATMRVVRAERDPYLWMTDNGDGTIGPRDEDGMILTVGEWQSYRDRIDAFYANFPPQAVASYNAATLRIREDAQKEQHSTVVAKATVEDPVKGYVYLIRGIATPWYKIGVSITPKIRLKQLGTQGPFRLELIHALQVDDMVAVESYFHRLFTRKRAEGEWFTLSPDDVEIFVNWSP